MIDPFQDPPRLQGGESNLELYIILEFALKLMPLSKFN